MWLPCPLLIRHQTRVLAQTIIGEIVKTLIGKNHAAFSLLATAVFSIGMTVTPVFGDIIYSGVQNISLQGAANTNQVWNIVLAADPAAWDTLNLGIAQVGS